jgi:hypothetical protein
MTGDRQEGFLDEQGECVVPPQVEPVAPVEDFYLIELNVDLKAQ